MRILVVQRSLSPPGGGNAVAAWMVHALAGVHEVGTLTAQSWSVEDTNAFYGTTIPAHGITRHVIPAPWSWLASMFEHRADRLRMCSVLRCARPLARHYDLLLTADNYGVFEKPGMQYLHYPAPLHPTPSRLHAIVNVYFAFCDRLVGIPWSRAAQNVTLANSRWTAEGLERGCGIHTAAVLYPPVIDPGEGLPWHARRNTFLCIGRFHESKRIDMTMSIVRRVRDNVLPDARLVIVGSPVDTAYSARIKRMAARDAEWIEIREDLSRAETNRLIGECRYGVQAMDREHFGMATAELARGGCLVFPHNSGGSPEVVNGETALLWDTDDDAVARITAIANDAALQGAVRARLRAHTGRFAPEQFVARMRDIVLAAPQPAEAVGEGRRRRVR